MRPFQARSFRWALTLVEMICVIAIIAILAALLLPGLAKARDRARQTQCAGQLKQVGIGFHSFAHDHNNLFPMQVPIAAGGSLEYIRAGSFSNSFAFRHFQALGIELGTPRVLVCPTDTRLPATGFSTLQNQNVSYFVAVNAEFRRPTSILAGDRNLTNDWAGTSPVQRLGPNYWLRWSHELHRFRGNLLFSDAHVDQLGGAALTGLGSGNNGTIYVLNLPAEPGPPPSGSRTPGYGPATRSSVPGTEGERPTSAPEQPREEPTPAKATPPETAARSGALPTQTPATILTESSARPFVDSSLEAPAARAPKVPTEAPERSTNKTLLTPDSGATATSAQNSTEPERGLLGDIVDLSTKFLWIYYLALVLLALLALLLRKRFAPTKDASPPSQKL